MKSSESLSDWRENVRKAEREVSLREAKARILSQTIGLQRDELERVISVAHATQSRTLGYDTKADEIAESSTKIEQGRRQLEQANARVTEARECLRKVKRKLEEAEKKEKSKKLVQEAWDELAILAQRFGATESFAGKIDGEACDGSSVKDVQVREHDNEVND